jgi:hypothetical protein
VLEGNLYVLIGCALFLLALAAAWMLRKDGYPRRGGAAA